MSYTLVLFFSITVAGKFGENKPIPVIATTSEKIEGFRSEKACETAGIKAIEDVAGREGDRTKILTQLTFTCLKKK